MLHVGRQHHNRGLLVFAWIGVLFALLLGVSRLSFGAEIPVSNVQSLMDCASGLNSAPGDVCMVQSGSYKLSSPLRITVDNLIVRCVDAPPACRIDGDGKGYNVQIQAHRVQFGEIGGGFQLENIGPNSAIEIDVGLEGVLIRGNRIESGIIGIKINGDQQFLRVFENIIDMGSTPGSKCILQESGGLFQAEFRGNRCSNAGDIGIHLVGQGPYTRLRITGGSECSVDNSGEHGILIAPGVNGSHLQELYISCNIVDNGQHGLAIVPTAKVDIRGLTIDDSGFVNNACFGAYISLEQGGRIQEVKIDKTTFKGNGQVCGDLGGGGLRIAIRPRVKSVVARDIRGVFVRQSKATDNKGPGFEIEVQSSESPSSTPHIQDVVFHDVTVQSNSESLGFGIRIAAEAPKHVSTEAFMAGDIVDVEISSSRVRNNDRHGILIEAQRKVAGVRIQEVQVDRNGVDAPRGWGIRIHALQASVENVLIGGCRLSQDQGSALNNTITGNGEGGIQIQANTGIKGVSILNNEISDNPRRGIHLQSATGATEEGPLVSIQENMIAGANATNGIDGVGILVETKGVHIRGNEISNNTIGIKVLQLDKLVIRQNNFRDSNRYDVDGMAVAPKEINAGENWWGSDGPQVLGNVTTIPELSSAVQIDICRLTPQGDVNGDGALDITDARMAAEAAIGARSLTAQEHQRADVAPPFGIIDITDARFIAELAVGVRSSRGDEGIVETVETPALQGVQVVRWGLGVLFRVSALVELRSVQVEVYDLSGQRVYRSAWGTERELRWNLLRDDGHPVANGIYLYVVTARDRDGRLLRSEVQKLLILH